MPEDVMGDYMPDEIVQLNDKAFSLFEGTEQDKEELLALHRG